MIKYAHNTSYVFLLCHTTLLNPFSAGRNVIAMQVLVINPGATSTKISVFQEEQEVFKTTIAHSAEELPPFTHVVEQGAYRKALILETLKEANYRLTDFDAVCGRGGLLRHIPSGTYTVTDAVIRDVMDPPYGEHASNLGVILSRELADAAGIPAYFVDPVCVDEMTPIAHVSGCEGMERESFFHALNQKSVARKAAKQLGKPYADARLIVVHLGGGVSVAAHENGLAVDVFNVKDEGAFGLDRGGSLPVNAVINYCFSGVTKKEAKKRLGVESGAYSYVGTKDFREIARKACEENSPKHRMVFDAMAYQLAKDIGAMAAVLRFQVDAIVYTGGMAYCKPFTDAISGYVGGLAPVLVLPGEEEMAALAEGALRVLHGEPVRDYEQEAYHAQFH